MENINPNLCTHAAFGFAGLDRNTFNIRVLDPYNELEENWGKGAFNRFTNMKATNPGLKTFISVGGWNEGNKMTCPQDFLCHKTKVQQEQLHIRKWHLIL